MIRVDFSPIPDPGYRGQKGTGSRIPDPQHCIQVSRIYLEEASLEPGEGAANPEVQLLARVHRLGLVLVRLAQAVHGGHDVLVRDGGELGAEDGGLVLPPYGAGHGLQHLEADVLALLHKRLYKYQCLNNLSAKNNNGKQLFSGHHLAFYP